MGKVKRIFVVGLNGFGKFCFSSNSLGISIPSFPGTILIKKRLSDELAFSVTLGVEPKVLFGALLGIVYTEVSKAFK